MGLILKQIFALIKLLNSETGSNQIATGVACGFILGMTPSFSLQTLLVFLCLFIFRIQMGAAFLCAFFFKFVAYLLDPTFDQIGSIVLESEALKPLFTTLYNWPIIPLTRFNNTIVMGSAVITTLLSPLIFMLSRILIFKYRSLIVARLQSTKFWKAIKATSFYQWYYKYDQLYGK
ncbi:MAG: TIGR03546 family protein [Bdellovibrionales bacterium]|nr:TIGR03546 family protein [Bdellovibrionales bacterium]